jgi:hypothetical protein
MKYVDPVSLAMFLVSAFAIGVAVGTHYGARAHERARARRRRWSESRKGK